MSTAALLARLRSLPAALLVVLVRAYQRVISPLLPPSCRFYPSCSAYAVTALTRHGAVRGGWLTVRRLTRCHPWNAGGVDHVPGRPGTPDHGEHRRPTPTSTVQRNPWAS